MKLSPGTPLFFSLGQLPCVRFFVRSARFTLAVFLWSCCCCWVVSLACFIWCDVVPLLLIRLSLSRRPIWPFLLLLPSGLCASVYVSASNGRSGSRRQCDGGRFVPVFFLFVSLFLALGHPVKASPSFSEKTGSMKSWCSNEEIMFEETAFNLPFWYYLRILRFPLSQYLILLSSLSSFPSDCLSFLKSILKFGFLDTYLAHHWIVFSLSFQRLLEATFNERFKGTHHFQKFSCFFFIGGTYFSGFTTGNN